MKNITSIFAAFAVLFAATSPVAAKDDPVELVKCEQSFGTIAVVDGDTQGWSEYGLGSPRTLINELAIESGCFTPISPASGQAADYLMNVIAGDKEEVDQSVEAAKSVAMTGLVNSGAAGTILSKVPGAGAVLGLFGGFGGKKKTLAAAIRVVSPANGQTMALGSGTVKKSSLSFNNGAGGWVQGAQNSGYAGSKDGKMLVEAFVKAFNGVVAQAPAMAAMSPAATAPATTQATVMVDTIMLEKPLVGANSLRSLGVGTTVTPTGKREDLFVEVEDNFGTTGWVSVEKLN